MIPSMLVRIVTVTVLLLVNVGAWTPIEPAAHVQSARQNDGHTKPSSYPQKFSPAIEELKDLIENDTRINMLFTQMLDDEVPHQRPFAKDPLNQTEIRNYHDLLKALDYVISVPPQWSTIANGNGFIAAPIVTILDYPMNTPAGYAAFLEPKVNQVMQNILNQWGRFLVSPQSAEVLNKSEQGWFGPDGLKALVEVLNAPAKTHYKFEDFFVCDPKATHYGFKSWDGFFTRHLRDNVRPVASPEDDNVIANACESKPWAVRKDVQLRSKFWIKSQPYSVRDMLAFDKLADEFAGGTVYQAYLSALSYHRWHAPVNGKIVKAFVQNGSYFSAPLYENKTFVYSIEPGGLNNLDSQEYLSALATRGIIFIEADNPAIGLMAFIAVGNYEVSTIDITIRAGERIKKGQEMGMFHFGGSSYVLLFRKGVNLEGLPSVANTTHNLAVRGQLAVVKP